MPRSLSVLLDRIGACRVCERVLPHEPRPVVAAHGRARILIAGQAPGAKVHASGVPWDDASGDTLRAWLGLDRPTFYDARKVALVPMGFCYPGKGKSGDLPPRPECAETWHGELLPLLGALRLRVVIGDHAQRYHLGAARKASLTETVRAFREYGERVIPLPHPSPRNRPWLAKNGWFEAELLPVLRERARAALSA